MQQDYKWKHHKFVKASHSKKYFDVQQNSDEEKRKKKKPTAQKE